MYAFWMPLKNASYRCGYRNWTTVAADLCAVMRGVRTARMSTSRFELRTVMIASYRESSAVCTFSGNVGTSRVGGASRRNSSMRKRKNSMCGRNPK